MSRLTKKLQQTLADMKQRCYNENHSHYKDYGGRGIKICDDLEDFECGYKEYCNRYGNELTQQEYDLLKEVLGE